MRILVRGVLAPIVICLFLALVVEAGLRLRQFATSPPAPHARDGENTRVLFVFDSIGGFLAESFSAANKTSEILRAGGKHFEVFEISRPALKTAEVIELLRTRIDEIKPQIIVMMVGKSDFRAGYAPLPNWFLKFRISRFVELLISDIRFHYLRMTTREETVNDLHIAFEPAWKMYAEKNYEAAIPFFETALRKYPNDEPALRALYFVYISTGKLGRGREFFSDLVLQSEKSELLRTFAMALEILDKETTPDAKKKRIDELQTLSASGRDARNSYKTSLWISKNEHDQLSFGEKLRALEPSQSSVVLPRTAMNLRAVLAELTEHGVRIIMLQYPTDHVATLENAVGPFRDRVEIYESRIWLLENKSRANAIDFVDADVEHLTAEGAAVVAERLAEIIQSR